MLIRGATGSSPDIARRRVLRRAGRRRNRLGRAAERQVRSVQRSLMLDAALRSCAPSSAATAAARLSPPSSRTSGITCLPKYSTSSWKCRKPSRIRSAPASLSARMRSAICCGVPIRLERKPSLYWTRSSKVDLAQLPSPFRRSLAGVLDLVAEGVDGFGIGLVDDLVRAPRLRFLLGLARDREGVDADLHRMVVLRRLGLDVVDLLADLLGRVAVGEVPVGDARRHVAGRARRAALEDLRQRLRSASASACSR